MKTLILIAALIGLSACDDDPEPRGTKEQVEEMKKKHKKASESFDEQENVIN